MKRIRKRGLLLTILGIAYMIPAWTSYAGIETLVVPYTATEDVVYGQKEGMGLTLDVLKPEKDGNNLGIVLVSSGSWKSSKSNDPEKVAELRKDHWAMGLLHGGFTVFIVRHGSGPRFQVPEMVEDIRRSVRFVRMKAADYGIDPDHIGITSGSSGAHLALMVGLTGDDGKPDSKDPVERVSSRVQAVVAWFPPTDFINWGKADGYKMIELGRPSLFKEMFGTISDLPEQLKSVSPIYFVTPDDPPLLLIHGDKDMTVPVQQSEILKAKYDEAGLKVKLIVQPDGPHTYWDGIEKQYVDVCQWFMDAAGGNAAKP
ncbi:MAG: alpha/beta hydrolase [Candidatus Hydrogenedentes bacterium]|nr:alpha/beta hydrolase [Candidatus Hydrogenedentota bacterium]